MGVAQLQVGCIKAAATANKPVGSRTEILVITFAAHDKLLSGVEQASALPTILNISRVDTIASVVRVLALPEFAKVLYTYEQYYDTIELSIAPAN